jgi:hypothetical protein
MEGVLQGDLKNLVRINSSAPAPPLIRMLLGGLDSEVEKSHLPGSSRRWQHTESCRALRGMVFAPSSLSLVRS